MKHRFVHVHVVWISFVDVLFVLRFASPQKKDLRKNMQIDNCFTYLLVFCLSFSLFPISSCLFFLILLICLVFHFFFHFFSFLFPTLVIVGISGGLVNIRVANFMKCRVHRSSHIISQNTKWTQRLLNFCLELSTGQPWESLIFGRCLVLFTLGNFQLNPSRGISTSSEL